MVTSPRPVHPHVCGEYCWRNSARRAVCGSSPRVWGIPVQSLEEPRAGRFIPTCVGNTVIEYSNPFTGNGSSPRVWGIRGEQNHSDEIWRFIPTCVGNTLAKRHQIHRDAGSSPRVWGIRSAAQSVIARIRFIPTCVGNTQRPSHAHQRRAVHPHVCGEYCPRQRADR